MAIMLKLWIMLYRLLEVNGKLVLTKTKEDMLRLLAVTPDPAQLVVMRARPLTSTSLLSTPSIIHQHDHSRELLLLREEMDTLRGRAEDAERAKDSFRSDNLRLTHRISYLEEQVSELMQRTKEEEALSYSSTVPQNPLTSSSALSNGVSSINTSMKASTGKPDVQVFQKGPQVTALVANLPGLEVGSSSPAESRHSLPTLRPKPNAPNSSSGGTTQHYAITNSQDVRSTKSLDFASDCSSSGGMNHNHRHHHHHRHLQNARSTNSLDMNKSDGTSTLQPKTKHHSHQRLYEATRITKSSERCVYDYNSEASSGIDHSKHHHKKHVEGHHQQSESYQLLPDMKLKPGSSFEPPTGTQHIHKSHDVRSAKSLDFDSEPSSTHHQHDHERNHHQSHSHSQSNHDTQSTSLDYGSEPTSHRTLRSYKKHYNYHNGNSSCTESKPLRPTPPKKPLRLSLHRATSLQSVSTTPTPPADYVQGSKKPTKRNHKGEAPPTPIVIQINKDPPQPPPRTPSRAESCQSALRWPSPAAALHQAVTLKTARSGTQLLGGNTNEKWC
jgi:sulfur dioxygenase